MLSKNKQNKTENFGKYLFREFYQSEEKLKRR
jgi:hypothetical protein